MKIPPSSFVPFSLRQKLVPSFLSLYYTAITVLRIRMIVSSFSFANIRETFWMLWLKIKWSSPALQNQKPRILRLRREEFVQMSLEIDVLRLILWYLKQVPRTDRSSALFYNFFTIYSFLNTSTLHLEAFKGKLPVTSIKTKFNSIKNSDFTIVLIKYKLSRLFSLFTRLALLVKHWNLVIKVLYIFNF